MAVNMIRFWSESLQRETGCCVILPDRQAATESCPVFYLLHGLSDDYTAWLRWTRLELYARNLPLIVVLADGGRSWYTNAAAGPAYEDALVKDLVGFTDRFFNTRKEAGMRAIGGLSMGAYGALKIGLKYPELFASISAHSGVYRRFDPERLDTAENPWAEELRLVFGSPEVIDANDPFLLAQQLAPKKAPAIAIDCGTEDPLLADNRTMHSHLESLGIAHRYMEYPGAHNWLYWDARLEETLQFHCNVFNGPN